MKTIMNTPRILLLLVFILFAVACNRGILKTTLEKKNPTEYEFNVPIDSIHKMIIGNRYSFFNNMAVMTIEQKHILPIDIFNKLGKSVNKYDMFIDRSFSIPKKSYTYKNHDGEFLEYRVSFYLHFDSIDINKTRITIETYEPELIRAYDFLPSPPHFVRNPKWLIGEPSTIEEYSLLLKIGKAIDERNMPSLILPNLDSKFEIVKY